MVHAFPYGPTLGFTQNLLSLEFHSSVFLLYYCYYARKVTTKIFFTYNANSKDPIFASLL